MAGAARENRISSASCWSRPARPSAARSAVCIREAQRTLAQSSKRLIESKIASLGLGRRFKIFSDKIETPGDGLIIFRGMQDHTAESIKSLEGFRIAWVDEAQSPERAQSVAAAADHPRRRLGAVGELESAAQDRMRSTISSARKKPEGAVVVNANWRDNPWFPACWRTSARRISRSIPIAMTTSGKAITSGRSRAPISRRC